MGHDQDDCHGPIMVRCGARTKSMLRRNTSAKPPKAAWKAPTRSRPARRQRVDGQPDAPLHAEHAGEDHQVVGRQGAAGLGRREGLADRRLAQCDTQVLLTHHSAQGRAPARSPSTTTATSIARLTGTPQRISAMGLDRRAPISRGITTAPAQEGQQHRQVDDEQAARRLLRRPAGDLRQPRAGPQRLHGDQCRRRGRSPAATRRRNSGWRMIAP